MEIHDEIFRDIQACWEGNATGEQVDRVKKWIEENEENHREYERLSRLYYRLGYAKRWDEIDTRAAGASLLKRISRTRKRKMSRYAWRCVAAACVIVGGMMFLWMKETPRTGVFPLNLSEVRSGSPKATLVLSDGRHVSLAADTLFRMQVQGTLLKEDAVGGLKYEIPDSLRDISRGQAITYNRLVVPRGGEYIMTLSDGTRVWLNAETELRFPVVFAKDKREVHVKGEAYFEVVKDSSRPFIVHASGVSTRVLGTSFNVMAYGNEPLAEITLVEGKVEVESRGNTCLLTPGWQAVVDSDTRQLSRREVNVSSYVSWRDGLFDFGEMTLEELVMKLSRWYDVDFFFVNSGARAKRFTGAIKRNNTLQFMLDFIEKTSDVYFKVDGKVIQIHER